MSYFIFALPALILAWWAQSRVKSNFSKYSKVRTMSGLTGEQVARRLLDAHGLDEVHIEEVNGTLTDHYDPRSKTLRLSPAVHNTPSVAAAGIAAHEMGHALQHADHYLPLTARSMMVPTVQFGSKLGPMVFMGGLLMSQLLKLNIGINVAWAGIILFGAVVLFSLVTLPVEFNASRRAKALLVEHGILDTSEMEGVNKVLNAAALTYVAAAVQSIGTLLYYVMILNGRGRRR